MAAKKDGIVESVEEFEVDDDVEIVDLSAGSPIVQQLDEGIGLPGAGTPDNLDLGDGRFDPAPPMATTKNYSGDDRALVDYQRVDEEVEILPITVENVPTQMFKVRVHTDVGPVFYGQHEIELKKGVLYRVPGYIIDYLAERKLIWSLA